jgi:hypothetical protein
MMMTGKSLILFLFLLLVWSLHVLSRAQQTAIEDMRAGVPDHQRRGVSILPDIPVLPLFFFGLAALIDHFYNPYGTLSIAGLHLAYGTFLTALLARNWLLFKNIRTGT